jgi:hypothetical protein
MVDKVEHPLEHGLRAAFEVPGPNLEGLNCLLGIIKDDPVYVTSALRVKLVPLKELLLGLRTHYLVPTT